MEQRGYGERGILPLGMKDILIEGSMGMDYAEGVISDIFERWGYRRIITSLLEYEDVLSRGIDGELRKGLLKFIEHPTGRVVTVRPDITPQVARIVATRLKEWPKPVRIYYSESVVRSIRDQIPHLREIFQIGAELVGIEGPEGDAEVVAMAVGALTGLGMREFHITIGHVGFLRGVLGGLPIEEADKQALLRAIRLKDRSGIMDVLSPLSIKEDYRRLLHDLPLLYGGREVIEEGLKAVKGLEPAEKALHNLREIWRLLELYGVSGYVTVDLGEARGFHYYTGMVLEVFLKGLGRGVGRGGRYDGLLERYGYDSPAVGFAFDMEDIVTGGLGRRAGRIDFLISGDEREAIRVADFLREMGFKVARDLKGMDRDERMDYCRKNGVSFLLDLLSEGLVRVEEVDTGRKATWRVEDILSGKVVLSSLKRG